MLDVPEVLEGHLAHNEIVISVPKFSKFPVILSELALTKLKTVALGNEEFGTVKVFGDDVAASPVLDPPKS